MSALWLPSFTLKALNKMGLRVRQGQHGVGRTRNGHALFTLQQCDPARKGTPRAYPRDFTFLIRTHQCPKQLTLEGLNL